MRVDENTVDIDRPISAAKARKVSRAALADMRLRPADRPNTTSSGAKITTQRSGERLDRIAELGQPDELAGRVSTTAAL